MGCVIMIITVEKEISAILPNDFLLALLFIQTTVTLSYLTFKGHILKLDSSLFLLFITFKIGLALHEYYSLFFCLINNLTLYKENYLYIYFF